MVLKFTNNRRWFSITLASGSADHIEVRRVDDQVYILSLNQYIPYVGLEVFDISTCKEIGDEAQSLGECFFQEGQCEDALGPDWEELGDEELMGLLEEYI